MKKALFNEIFGLMKELGIKLQLGTRTNVKKHPSLKHFGKDLVSEEIIKEQIEKGGVDRVLKVFEGEGAYIPQFDDYQGGVFLKNLNKLKTVLHPPELPMADIVKFPSRDEGIGSMFKKKVDDPGSLVPGLRKGILGDDATKTTDEIIKGMLLTRDGQVVNPVFTD